LRICELIRRGTAFKWITVFNFETSCIKKSSDTTIKTDDCYKFDKLTIVEKCSGLCEGRFIQRGIALQLLAHPANEIFGGGEGCYWLCACDESYFFFRKSVGERKYAVLMKLVLGVRARSLAKNGDLAQPCWDSALIQGADQIGPRNQQLRCGCNKAVNGDGRTVPKTPENVFRKFFVGGKW